ncbi:polyprenyl diphosphate synthase [Chloroflexota bacterium]
MADSEKQKYSDLKIPQHVVIIPDGNRRWARNHHLPESVGHEKGVEAIKIIVEAAYGLKISCLSFWGASIDNLVKRPAREIRVINKLFENSFKQLVKNEEIHQNKVRVRVLGEWETLLNEGTKKAIRSAINSTEGYDSFSLNFLIAYDGKTEMISTIQKITQKIKSNPEIIVTPELVKENLYTCDLPPVDLVIRTGEEPHLSAGFMMWELSDSQLFFSDKCWPDFTDDNFKEAIVDFTERERRLGR